MVSMDYLTLVWTATNCCCSSATNFDSLLSCPDWTPIPSVKLWNTVPTLFLSAFRDFKAAVAWATSILPEVSIISFQTSPIFSYLLSTRFSWVFDLFIRATVKLCGVANLAQKEEAPLGIINSGHKLDRGKGKQQEREKQEGLVHLAWIGLV